MTHSALPFDSIIYNGLDNPRDGIGNHLALLDQLIFADIPNCRKSLSPITELKVPHAYGQVEIDRHLARPDQFRHCLFLDIARETWNPVLIRRQMEKTIQHKRTFGAVTGVYLMWESDRMWDDYAELISIYDFCIVTSSLLDRQLADLDIDYVKLPHPYKYDDLTPIRETGSQPIPLKFGISAGFWPRKNVFLLAEVFADTFGNSPDVSLTIHTRFGKTFRDLKEETARIEALADQYSNMEVIHQGFLREEYIQWMSALDIYCFVSSGEGYSVTPREALHLGVPVVLHDSHVHREFSDLPGIIKVPSMGLQKAIANNNDPTYDVGQDWCIDGEALRDALMEAFTNHQVHQQALDKGYQQILNLHDPINISTQWHEALANKFMEHSAHTVLRYPQVTEYPLFSEARTLDQVNLRSPGFLSQTGFFEDGRVLCVKSEHEPGHCLYGPYFRVRQPGQFVLTLSVRVFGNPQAGTLFEINIVDSVLPRVQLNLPIDYNAMHAGENSIEIHLDSRVGQVLEFRVLWHGNCDLMISGLKIEEIE